MRKTVKKLTAVGLTLTSVMGLVACGNNNASTESKSTVDWASVEKPEAFTVMVDGTVPQMEEWGDKFDEQLKELTELDFTVTRPDHNSYYDAVANSMLDANSMPDVLILSSDYLALYARQGLLWDMTDAWNNSATKASGRLIADAEKVMQANYVRGVDGEKALYGFVPTRGNGCCTYVKEAWATAAGYTKADLQKQMTYDEFYTMLKKMKAAKGVDYVISAPGFYSKEAPYTNYLPEFYQNAQFTFYYDKAQGKYVDGFSEQEMKDALQRIQNAVKDGLINKESSTKTTFTSRNDFKSSDPKTESGVFTYWAGTWADKLKNEVMTSGLDGALTAIKGAWAGLAGWFESTIYKPIADKVNSIIEKGRSITHLGGGSNDSEKASGGFVYGRQHVVVGEAGMEAIIPLSGSRRARGMDLWQKAGAMLGIGVGSYQPDGNLNLGDEADYGGGNDDTGDTSGITFTAPAGGTSDGGVSISIGSLAPTFTITGGEGADPESIMAIVRSQCRSMADDIAAEIADKVAGINGNQPLRA